MSSRILSSRRPLLLTGLRSLTCSLRKSIAAEWYRPFSTSMALTARELSSYLADSPPAVVRLEIGKHFAALSDKQKRYAHHISQ